MPALIKAKETGQTNKSFYMEKYSNLLQSVYTVIQYTRGPWTATPALIKVDEINNKNK